MSSKNLTQRQFAFIRKLRHKKYQTTHAAFVVTGKKSVIPFLHSCYPLHYLLATEAFVKAHPRLVKRHATILYLVSPERLQWLSPLKNSGDVLLVAGIPAASTIEPLPNQRMLVLDGVNDPGNLGTMVRIADWYGMEAIVASPNSVTCYNTKAVQASMGSLARVSVHYLPLDTYLKKAKAAQLPILGAVLDGSSLHATSLPRSGCLVIGNESHGISEALEVYLTNRITIPKYGQAESLNAAIAAAVICDHWVRSG